MTDIQDEERENTLFEYLITGLVILTFAGLYYIINHFGDDEAGSSSYFFSRSNDNAQSEYALDALRTAGVVVDNNNVGSDTPSSTATLAGRNQNTDPAALTNDTAETLAATNTAQQAELEKAQAGSEQAENEQALAALAAEKTQLQGEISELRADRDRLLQTNTQLVEDAEAVIQQISKTQQAAAAVPQQKPVAAPSANSLSYQLPDGTPVDIDAEGFEGLLKQALEVRAHNTPMIFDAIYFDSGASTPTQNSQQQIRATAALLNTYSDANVLIKGHTDNTGNTRSNTVLSLTRSGYMKDALVKLGIDARRINVEGVGALEPIAPNDTEDGRNSNRRIELILTD